MAFRKGDKVRFLGAAAHKGDCVDIFEWTLDFTEGYEYEIDDVNLGELPVEIDGWCLPEDIFELVEYNDPMIEYDQHDKQVVDALNSPPEEDDDVYCYASKEDYDNLRVIYEKDYKFYEELSGLIEYLASTYSDKYEASTPNGFNPKELLTTEVCMFSVSKYLKRYNTEGFEKSRNKKDVLKSIHYLLISLNSKK